MTLGINTSILICKNAFRCKFYHKIIIIIIIIEIICIHIFSEGRVEWSQCHLQKSVNNLTAIMSSLNDICGINLHIIITPTSTPFCYIIYDRFPIHLCVWKFNPMCAYGQFKHSWMNECKCRKMENFHASKVDVN